MTNRQDPAHEPDTAETTSPADHPAGEPPETGPAKDGTARGDAEQPPVDTDDGTARNDASTAAGGTARDDPGTAQDETAGSDETARTPDADAPADTAGTARETAAEPSEPDGNEPADEDTAQGGTATGRTAKTDTNDGDTARTDQGSGNAGRFREKPMFKEPEPMVDRPLSDHAADGDPSEAFPAMDNRHGVSVLAGSLAMIRHSVQSGITLHVHANRGDHVEIPRSKRDVMTSMNLAPSLVADGLQTSTAQHNRMATAITAKEVSTTMCTRRSLGAPRNPGQVRVRRPGQITSYGSAESTDLSPASRVIARQGRPFTL